MEHKLPTTKGLQMVVVYSIMAIIPTITFALRVFVRSKLVKRSWEDWAAATGWFVYIVFVGSALVGPFYGTGQHADLIPPSYLPIALRQFYIAEVTYVAANLAVKSSIALMLLRFAVEDQQRKVIYVVTAITQIYSTIFLFIFLFQCMPISFFWTKFTGVTQGRCINPDITVKTGYIYLAVTIIFDWTMAILPWFIVRKMHFDFRTRMMIAVVLGLGSIASIATLIRIPYVTDLASTHDFLYDNVNLANWACVETGLSIIATSAATLKPLFRRNSSTGGPSGRLPPKLNSIILPTDATGSTSSNETKGSDAEITEVRQVV